MDKELLDYFKGDEFCSAVWKSKYSQEKEITPDDMHKRMSKEFARIRFKKDNSKSLNEWELYFFDIFKDFQKNIPQGRVMAGVGVYDSYRSLSNCLRLPPPEDSYSSIMEVDTMLISSAKRGCGYGLGLSKLRPKGALTNNSSKTSTGVLPFGERYSNSTKEVGQEGRRGACLEDLDIRHPEATGWATVKLDKTKLTGANISFKMWEDFLVAVKNNQDYILRFPCDIKEEDLFGYDYSYEEALKDAEYNVIKNGFSKNSYYKKVKAKELWDSAIHTVWSDGCPGLLFWERVVNYDPSSVYKQYQIDGTNACVTGNTEILTKDGYKEIYTLVDQEVEIWNGFEWSLVTPKVTGYNQHMLKVTLSDGRELTSTDYHKWILADGYTNKFKKVETKDLKIGDKIIKYNFPVIKEGEQVSLKHAYTQGFISAEGMDDYKFFWLYEPKYICKDRLDIRVEGAEFININEVKRKTIYYNDVYKEKSYVPFEWNLTSKIEWLSGLFDGDGTELIEGGLQICSTDFIFLKDLQKLLSTLGVNCKIINAQEEGNRMLPNGKGDLKEYFCQKSYRLCIGAVQMQDLKELGLQCSRMSFDKNPQRDASQFVKIIKIEDAGYEDKVYCFTEPLKHFGIFNGILTGQCGEQPMAVYDTCRLLTLMLLAVVDNPFTKNATINYSRLYDYSYIQMEIGDDLIDLEIEYLQRIIDKINSDPEDESTKAIELKLWTNVLQMAKNGRRVGGGITALADMLAAINIKYDSEKALEVVDKVMKTKFKAELNASIDLVIKYGTFVGWDPIIEENGNDWYNFVKNEFPDEWERMQIFGRRFINWSTIAPVGTTSIITKGINYPNVSSGCEPQFSLYYFRNKKVEKDTDPFDYVDEVGIKWKQYPVMMGAFKDWLLIHTNSQDLDFDSLSKEALDMYFKESPWYGCTANDISWEKRIEMQSILQKYTTSAISSTINLPKDVKEEVISNIYMYAWKKGLKGITCYRDGSKGNVLSHEAFNSNKFEYVDAVKRPKSLNCDVYSTTNAGNKWNVIVGLMNEKPYEVFAIPYFTDETKLEIVKLKKGRYDLLKNGEAYSENFTAEMNNNQEVITRLISTSLRHGTDIKFIVEQLNKSYGDITSFSKAIARILKKYIPEGSKSTLKCSNCGGNNVVFEEGCQSCKDCGHSKCG